MPLQLTFNIMAAYTEEQIDDKFEAVIQDIIDGNSLRKALGFYNISSATFYNWIDEREGDDESQFLIKSKRKKQYARACEERADKIFEDILDIADKQGSDVIGEDDNGNTIIDHNVIARNRLQVDARKWVLAKMNPKKFGDKTDITSDGKELAAPTTIINLGSGLKPTEDDATT